MIINFLKKDFMRNKVISITLIIFILLATLLVSSGTQVITELLSAINNFFIKSSVPHFVQIHSGELNKDVIKSFASSNSLVKDFQVSEMQIIDSSYLYFGKNKLTNKDSVMDNGFVVQSLNFDYLLNLNNEVISVNRGEIAVPIFYMQKYNLKIGDPFTINKNGIKHSFVISSFIRDVQMNPSIISSKRFVVNKSDFANLYSFSNKLEYLIEFQLTDLTKINQVKNDYVKAGLPNKGPTIDYSLIKTLNALSDGIIAVVLYLVSLLLIIIAMLCLRFILLTTIEEDYQEIGVMKALGIKMSNIKQIYMAKYIFITAIACLGGYFLSLLTGKFFTKNITLYIGSATKSAVGSFIPFLATVFVFLLVIIFCLFILRGFKKISATEALRTGTLRGYKGSTRFITLSKSKFLSSNIMLALKDMFLRYKTYLVMLSILVICCFIIIVPLNFYSTLTSPSFISYMGIGQCDIRIDLQHSTSDDFNKIINYINKDSDVEKHASYITSKYKILNSEGVYELIDIETGNYTVFPMHYLKGKAPISNNEIAFSLLNAKEYNLAVGDLVTVKANSKQFSLKVCGIYQDISNGGKTAKANLPANDIIYMNTSINVKQGIEVKQKAQEYQQLFDSAKVTVLKDYLAETLSTTLTQVKKVANFSVIITLTIVALITYLFIKLLLAKDKSQYAILCSLGFSKVAIQKQYFLRLGFILMIAVSLGMLLANILGEGLISFLMSFMGASQISFVINPLIAYVFVPTLFIVTVMITCLIAVLQIRDIDITNMLRK